MSLDLATFRHLTQVLDFETIYIDWCRAESRTSCMCQGRRNRYFIFPFAVIFFG